MDDCMSMLAAWDIKSFLSNSKNWGTEVGGAFVALVGLILVIFGAYKTAKAIFSNGKGQPTSWGMVIAAFVVGGGFLFGGINLLLGVAKGGDETINQLGGGVWYLSNIMGIL